jgi:hypothetical protein
MYLRFISLINLMCALAILSVDLTNPSDPLFFIVSGGILEEIVRFTIVFAMLYVAFVALPAGRTFKKMLLLIGWLLVIFGAAGFLFNSFDFRLYEVIKPLDFLVLIEAGLVMNLLVIEPQKTTHFMLLPNHRHLIISAFGLHLRKIKSAS